MSKYQTLSENFISSNAYMCTKLMQLNKALADALVQAEKFGIN